MAYINDKVIKLDNAVFSFAKHYRPKINPINSQAIVAKITKRKQQFNYKEGIKDHSEEIKALGDIKVPKSVFSDVYKDKIKELQTKLKLLDATGTDNFFKYSKKLYGMPSKKLVEKAYSLMNLPDDPEEKKIDIQHAKEILRNQLDAFKIDWNVYGKKMLAYASVKPEKREIKLNSTHDFSEKTVKRLAVHEIGTHGVRAMNGRIQPLRLFKNFPHYLKTEEGLAVFNEKITGLLDNRDIKKYAARVIAVYYGQNHTLFETYRHLRKYIDKETAAVTALRVKRGLPHSNSMGCHTKDYLYLKGFFDVYKYSKNHDLRALYYGKINLKYIDLIKKIEPELKKIKYFPPIVQSFEIKKEVFS